MIDFFATCIAEREFTAEGHVLRLKLGWMVIEITLARVVEEHD